MVMLSKVDFEKPISVLPHLHSIFQDQHRLYIFHIIGLDNSFAITMKLSLIQEREMISDCQARLKLSNLRKLPPISKTHKTERIMKWVEDSFRIGSIVKLRLPHISFCPDRRFAGYYRLED